MTDTPEDQTPTDEQIEQVVRSTSLSPVLMVTQLRRLFQGLPADELSLEEMQAEVYDVNEKNGWFGGPRSVAEGGMLTVTEVAESVEAWRNWGMKDMTGIVSLDKALTTPEGEVLHKPEGVGSEYADILIRLLDQCYRDGVDLRAEYTRKIRYNRLRGFKHGGKNL